MAEANGRNDFEAYSLAEVENKHQMSIGLYYRKVNNISENSLLDV
jgi:hypothetical protein